jgi:Protein of unknown function (DUF1670)
MTSTSDKQEGQKELELTSGTVSYYAHPQKAAAPSLTKTRVLLRLTLDADEDTLAAKGLAALRQERIFRLCTDACRQGALLGYEDLASLLSTSLSTIKRDLRLLKKQRVIVPIYRRRQRRLGSDGKLSDG